MKLSEELKLLKTTGRPDEWTIGRLVRKAEDMEKLLMAVTDCSASMARENWFSRRDEVSR